MALVRSLPVNPPKSAGDSVHVCVHWQDLRTQCIHHDASSDLGRNTRQRNKVHLGFPSISIVERIQVARPEVTLDSCECGSDLAGFYQGKPSRAKDFSEL